MPDIRSGDHHGIALPRQDRRLRGENNVGVEGEVRRGGAALLACLSPKLGCLKHCLCCDRQVARSCLQLVEMQNTTTTTSPKQLTSNFIVGDLGNKDAHSLGENSHKPLLASLALGCTARMCHEA